MSRVVPTSDCGAVREAESRNQPQFQALEGVDQERLREVFHECALTVGAARTVGVESCRAGACHRVSTGDRAIRN